MKTNIEALKQIKSSESFRRFFLDNQRNDAFAYVPSGREKHVFGIIKKRAKLTNSFCDAGCGYPVFPMLAYQHGFNNAVGIENFKPYLEVLKPMFGDMVIEDDIKTHDYSSYDVIYMYSPLFSDEMLELIRKIKSEMKKHALLVVTGLIYTLHEHEYKKRGLVRDREFGIDYFIR